MELQDILREYKRRCGYNNKELASLFGVSHNTVCRWLRGEIRSIQDETAQRISHILGYDIQAILQGQAIDLKRPILGHVKAGYDMYLEENYLGMEACTLDEYEKGDFFLKVSGDSMLPSGIIDGSLIYVKATTNVNNGDIVVALIDQEVTVKIYKKEQDKISLVASNPQYPTRTFNSQEIDKYPLHIIGKVLFCKNIY